MSKCRLTEANPRCRKCGTEGMLIHRQTSAHARAVRTSSGRHCRSRCAVTGERTTRGSGSRRRRSLHHHGRRSPAAIWSRPCTASPSTISWPVSPHARDAIEAPQTPPTHGRQRQPTPPQFDRVTTIGVDEQAKRHTRFADTHVTEILNPTPAHEGTGRPAAGHGQGPLEGGVPAAQSSASGVSPTTSQEHCTKPGGFRTAPHPHSRAGAPSTAPIRFSR